MLAEALIAKDSQATVSESDNNGEFSDRESCPETEESQNQYDDDSADENGDGLAPFFRDEDEPRVGKRPKVKTVKSRSKKGAKQQPSSSGSAPQRKSRKPQKR